MIWRLRLRAPACAAAIGAALAGQGSAGPPGAPAEQGREARGLPPSAGRAAEPAAWSGASAKDLPETDALETAVWALWHDERYGEALPKALRLAELRAASLGPSHPLTARALYFLADLRRVTGRPAAARGLYERALAVWRKAGPAQEENAASALHYLGMVRWNLGDTVGARAAMEEALGIRERLLGPGHEQVAAGLHALGSIALAEGDRAAARRLIERAAAIWDSSFGASHPHAARGLAALARVDAAEGGVPRALERLERALAIRKRVFGERHPLVAGTLADQAALAESQGALDGAERLLRRALSIETASSEPSASMRVALARVRWRRGDARDALEQALEAERSARERFLSMAAGLRDAEALRYESVRTRGVDLLLTVLAGARVDRADATSQVLDQVVRSRGMVRDILPAARRGGDGGPAVDAGLAAVRAGLPAGAALISYVRYRPVPAAGATAPGPAGDAYGAFVLEKGRAPRWVSLAGAALVDRLAGTWSAEAGSDPRGRAGSLEAVMEAGRRLRETVWDPAAALAPGARRLFVVPDGALHLVSLPALPGKDGRFLLETGPSIDVVTAERDLAAARTAPAGEGVLVVGAPDFGPAPEPGRAASMAIPSCREPPVSFVPLPGAAREARQVSALWGRGAEVVLLSGAEATEEAFRRAAPGRLGLHIATHRFAARTSCPAPLADGEEIGQAGTGSPPLSGLALAMANRAPQIRAGSADGNDEADGLLTAEEIAALDLSGVEWAVLSACRTGHGDILPGEGVLGLRRAFRIAGVRTLIMTLWDTEDASASIWMRRFHQARLDGLSSADAARRASLDMLAAQRRRGSSIHPYFWGGFVAAGGPS
ncbi:MAG TPA: CHAT domain-containing tetratricopeptide repeat protein [Candidatus Polarisedimenticolia bacterium]|nr:CHAT domain-containing tetratricopeptide repeat protein [Candidatus Polarisedimenticolia bacterium]